MHAGRKVLPHGCATVVASATALAIMRPTAAFTSCRASSAALARPEGAAGAAAGACARLGTMGAGRRTAARAAALGTSGGIGGGESRSSKTIIFRIGEKPARPSGTLTGVGDRPSIGVGEAGTVGARERALDELARDMLRTLSAYGEEAIIRFGVVGRVRGGVDIEGPNEPNERAIGVADAEWNVREGGARHAGTFPRASGGPTLQRPGLRLAL